MQKLLDLSSLRFTGFSLIVLPNISDTVSFWLIVISNSVCNWLMLCFLPFIAKVLSLDVDSATARLRYLSEAQEAVKQDIALTKRATEKAVADITQAEADKLKQVCTYDTHFCRHTNIPAKVNLCV